MTTNTNAALRSAAESALEALEILNGIDTETESVTIHVSDEIAALRAALTAAAAPAAVAGPSAPTLERLREWEKNGELMERVWGTLVEQENEIKRLTAAPTTQAAPQPAVQQGGWPTMDDAIAAGDGTLHGAIDHWQRRALDAERVLLSRGLVLEEAAKACEERERRANREDVRATCRLCAKDIRSLAVVNQSLTTGPTAHPAAPVAQGDARVQGLIAAADYIDGLASGYAAEHSYTEPSPMAKVAAALRQKAEQEDAAYQARRSDQGLMESEWGPMEDAPPHEDPPMHVAVVEGDDTVRTLQWNRDHPPGADWWAGKKEHPHD